nr:hypothetical protein [Salmonella enterica subsp. enterica serovar Weltevreden]
MNSSAEQTSALNPSSAIRRRNIPREQDLTETAITASGKYSLQAAVRCRARSRAESASKIKKAYQSETGAQQSLQPQK